MLDTFLSTLYVLTEFSHSFSEIDAIIISLLYMGNTRAERFCALPEVALTESVRALVETQAVCHTAWSLQH